MATTSPLGIDLDTYKWGFRDPRRWSTRPARVWTVMSSSMISHMKNEPDWMRAYRLHSLEHFQKRPMPTWGADLGQIHFDDIYYYLKPSEREGRTWDDVPEDIKRTFDRLGIPQAEKKYLAGVGAQYESESVYHNLKEEWEKLGVIFLDTDSALSSTLTSSKNTSALSSRPRTTSWPRSTARCGPVGRSSTSPRV